MPGTLAQSEPSKLDEVEDVVIDNTGRFKYILCKVYEPNNSTDQPPFKLVVRGTGSAEYHCMFHFDSWWLLLI